MLQESGTVRSSPCLSPYDVGRVRAPYSLLLEPLRRTRVRVAVGTSALQVVCAMDDHCRWMGWRPDGFLAAVGAVVPMYQQLAGVLECCGGAAVAATCACRDARTGAAGPKEALGIGGKPTALLSSHVVVDEFGRREETRA